MQSEVPRLWCYDPVGANVLHCKQCDLAQALQQIDQRGWAIRQLLPSPKGLAVQANSAGEPGFLLVVDKSPA